MTERVSGVANGPATAPAPESTGAYDPDRRHQVQAFIPEPDQRFRLPHGITKAQAMNTICRALRLLGAGEREIAVWRLVADRTEREAWNAVDRSPVNWRRQCDMAREMGITERQFRRIEARLALFGVLARMTADNGYRGRRSGQPARAPISCGLSLEPALANHQAFAVIVEEAETAEETRQEAVLNARSARKRVGQLVEELKEIEMRQWAKDRLDELDHGSRPACPRAASAEQVSLWHADLLALEDAIREALRPLPAPTARPTADIDGGTSIERAGAGGGVAVTGADGRSDAPAGDGPARGRNDAGPLEDPRRTNTAPVENSHDQQEMSAAPDIGVRSHIQPTTESGRICKAPGPAPTRHSSHRSDPESGFRHREDGREPPGSALSPTLASRLTERDVRAIASDDVALWLDACDDWQDALPHILRELGANVSAWHDACDAMGETVAFLALLVIDRNRFHPDTPILNPGGALRAFTARARIGELDLTRSILGIWERERQGRQPKGPLVPRRLS